MIFNRRHLPAGQGVAADVALAVAVDLRARAGAGRTVPAPDQGHRHPRAALLLGKRRRRAVQVAARARIERVARRYLTARHHAAIVEEIGAVLRLHVQSMHHFRLRVNTDTNAGRFAHYTTVFRVLILFEGVRARALLEVDHATFLIYQCGALPFVFVADDRIDVDLDDILVGHLLDSVVVHVQGLRYRVCRRYRCW